MASSTSAGKKKVAKWIDRLIGDNDKFRILDLGCGKGIYGKLISKPCYKIAVDVMPYKEKYSLMDFYNEFYQFDIRDIGNIVKLGYFDLVIMGDVLEHLTPKEARTVLDTVEQNCNALLVAVPYLYEQHVDKNHWENHLQPDLTEEIFAERYPEFSLYSIHNCKQKPWNGGAFYGYYIWQKGG